MDGDRTYRAGIDLGGTKIEIAVLATDGTTPIRRRVPNPGTYEGAIRATAALVHAAEAELAAPCTVGIGIPGAISETTGLVRNANSIWMNGRPFAADAAAALARSVRVENDANCMALSEASDGAGAGHRVVFGVILGTGCGGGLVIDGTVRPGRLRIAGEWGHTPLPWPAPGDLPYPPCFCGLEGCLERYIAGPSLAADADGPGHRDASPLEARAAAGDPAAAAAIARHASRAARGLAVVTTILDPDIIVIAGGLSAMRHLYAEVPALMRRYLLADGEAPPIVPARHGDSTGVRGAAWLWPIAGSPAAPDAP